MLTSSRRLQTLEKLAAGNSSSVTDATSSWADAGFFLQLGPDQAPSLVCFHCGHRRPAVAVPADNPLKLHLEGSPGCQLARLLQTAEAPAGATALPAEAAKLQRACSKLLHDLRSESVQRVLGHVTSYGFAKSRIVFLACREFMHSRNGVLQVSRPGDFIALLHDCEAMLDCVPNDVAEGIERALAEACQAADPGVNSPQSSPACTRTAAASASVQSDLARHRHADDKEAAANQEDDEDASVSDQCIACKSARRSQVLLPCAHFLLCQGCLSHERDCPKCGVGILASIRAFIA